MKKAVKSFILFLLIIMATISGFSFFSEKYNDYKENKDYKTMEQKYYKKNNTKEKNDKRKENSKSSSLDIKGIRKENKNVVGWLYCKGVVSYPLVQGNDNIYYLSHNALNQSNVSGSIFLDYRMKNKFEENNCIIYGHNMKNKYMFGSLLDYVNYSFAETHNIFYIDNGVSKQKYKLFSVRLTHDGGNDYSINLTNEEFQNWFNEMKNTSYYKDTNISMNKTITLSTCYSNDASIKLVLHLVRI